MCRSVYLNVLPAIFLAFVANGQDRSACEMSIRQQIATLHWEVARDLPIRAVVTARYVNPDRRKLPGPAFPIPLKIELAVKAPGVTESFGYAGIGTGYRYWPEVPDSRVTERISKGTPVRVTKVAGSSSMVAVSGHSLVVRLETQNGRKSALIFPEHAYFRRTPAPACNARPFMVWWLSPLLQRRKDSAGVKL
jgi:hypothetical protein